MSFINRMQENLSRFTLSFAFYVFFKMRRIHIIKNSIIIVIFLFLPSSAYAQGSTVTNNGNFLQKTSLRIYCTFAPVFNQDNWNSACRDKIVTVSNLAGLNYKKQNQTSAANNSLSRVDDSKTTVRTGQITNSNLNTSKTNTVQTTVYEPVISKEVRTVIEYRGSQVGPQGPQGVQGIPGVGGGTTFFGGGGVSVINSPVLGGSGLTISNSVVTGSSFTNATFTNLPIIPLTYGALLVGNASGTATELLPGTAGYILTTNASGTPMWKSVGAVTGSTTNSFFSSGNILTSDVNGIVGTSTIIGTSTATSSGNFLYTIINGITSSFANIINSLTAGVTGNTLTINTNGVVATSSIISNNTVSSSANTLTSSVNGVTSTSSLVNSNVLSTAGSVLSSTVNGVTATTSLANALASSTTNTLTSAGNTLTSNVNGVISTTSAVTSNTLATSTNSFATIVNGITSAFTNLINSFTQSLAGNTLTTTINGVTATSSVISSNTVSSAANTLTTNVNGVTSTSTIINSNVLSTSGQVLSSTVNGVLATTSLANAIASSTTNTLSSTGNVLTNTTNGVLATSTIIQSNTLSTTTNSFSTLVNGIQSAVTNIINSNTLTFATSTGNLVSALNGVPATANLNGLTTANFATNAGITNAQLANSSFTTTFGSTGTDVNISGSPTSLGGTLTLNIPDASATARGLVTTGTQTFSGAKTFSSAPTISTFTQGSVVFAGTSGLLSQNNTNFFWDNTNSRLGLGTTTPGSRLDVIGNTANGAAMRLFGRPGDTTYALEFNSAGIASANNWAIYSNGATGSNAGSLNFFNPSNPSGNLQIGANGNVGIGTNTAGNALHVASSTGAVSGLRLGITSATATTTSNGKSLTVNASGDVVLVDASAGGGSGITSLNGLTAPAQLFVNDTNLTITSSLASHTLGWSGLLAISRGGTNSTATPTAGGVSYGSGSAYAFTAAGTSGQVLQSNGAGVPTWLTAPWVSSLGAPTGSNANGGSIASNILTLSFADGTNPGIVSTLAQTFAGSKTFSSAPTFSTFTQGSISFIGVGGLLSQNNSQFFWNNTTNSLGIGTATPGNALHIASSTGAVSGLRLGVTSATTPIAGNGKVLSVDASGNVTLAVDSSVLGTDLIATKATALTAAMSNTAQVVIFPTEAQDINAAHNTTTGVYTTPTGAGDTYTVEAQLGFTIANQLSRTPCIAIRRAGVIVTSSCNSDYNDTGGGTTGSKKSVAVSATIVLTAGQTIDVITYTDTNPTAGTVPTFDVTAGTNYFVVKRVGNAAVASDERLKSNVQDFGLGLLDILGVRTVSFNYNGQAQGAQNDGIKHVGIIAQELQNTSFGEWSVATGTDGYHRYNDRPLLYGLVNSIKDLNQKLDSGFAKVSLASSTAWTEQSAVDTYTNNILAEAPRAALGYIKQQMTLGKKAVEDFVAYRVTALRGYFDEIFTNRSHQKELCVGENGNETCITKAQLDALLQNAGQTGQAPSGVTGTTAGNGEGGSNQTQGDGTTTSTEDTPPTDSTPSDPVQGSAPVEPIVTE